MSLLPPQSPGHDRGWGCKLSATSKKDGERLCGSGRRAAAQGFVAELGAKESLRWEGVLQDPQAEEKRLELYRANRRQRYIAHREALLEETQENMRQTFPEKSTEKKAFTETDQQEAASLLHLSID